LRPIPAVLKVKTQDVPPAKTPESKAKESEPLQGTKQGKAQSKVQGKTQDKVQDQAATAGGKTSGAAAKVDTAKAAAKKADTAKTPVVKGTAANGQTGEEAAQSKKTAGRDKKTVARGKAQIRGPHFVPPPPPSTPTMMGDSSDFAFYSGMPIEMLSKEALKDRAKEISIQYKDACRELEDHSRQKDEKIQRAQEFEGLYKEGVVSRRELEESQKEAAEVNSDIDRLAFKVKELKGLQDRITRRLTPTVAKRKGHKLIN
jgi:hypothetical protein